MSLIKLYPCYELNDAKIEAFRNSFFDIAELDIHGGSRLSSITSIPEWKQRLKDNE